MAALVAAALGECAGTACIVLQPCGPAATNWTMWRNVSAVIDGADASNIALAVPPPPNPRPGFPPQPSAINCPGPGTDCHAWGPGFADRNEVFRIAPGAGGTRVESWPSSPSLPVGPGQLTPGLCLAAVPAEQAGARLQMLPCGPRSLRLRPGPRGELVVATAVPVAAPLCVAAEQLPPTPPPGRPTHWFSCTANLAGGARLPHPFCNASLPEEARLEDLVARATCQEKAAVMTSSGAAIPRLGVPRMGSAEDTHGVCDRCLAPERRVNSTGCPTTFPSGPGLGATFDRETWRAMGRTMAVEARALNNEQAGPLFFLDPDVNLLRDPRWGRAQEVPGECPFLTAEYGVAIVTSTQTGGGDPSRLSAVVTMKHFQVYDLEGYQPNQNRTGLPPSARCDQEQCGRATFDMYPPARDYYGWYLEAFEEIARRAKPAALMRVRPRHRRPASL